MTNKTVKHWNKAFNTSQDKHKQPLDNYTNEFVEIIRIMALIHIYIHTQDIYLIYELSTT